MQYIGQQGGVGAMEDNETNFRLLPGSDLLLPPGFLLTDRAVEGKRTITVRIRRKQDTPPLSDTTRLTAAPTILPHEKFVETYGADPNDLAKVKRSFEHYNNDPNFRSKLEVREDRARRSIFITGSIDDLAKAFGVRLGIYADPSTGKHHLIRQGSVYIRSELLGIVEGVFGLDDRPVAKRATNATNLASSESALTPVDIATKYNFPSTTGNDQTVALLEFGGGYDPADIKAYLHRQTINATDVCIDAAINDPADKDAPEVTLDIETVGAVAPDAQILVLFAPLSEQGWIDAVSAALHGGIPQLTTLPQIISISWGGAELQTTQSLTWTRNGLQALHESFTEAAHLGVTVLAASGDFGSGCNVGDLRAHVLYPASDPGVIACGGTSCIPAFFPAEEQTWPGSGGGISEVFPIPAYQQAANLPVSVNDGSTMAGVPDIAGYAYPGCKYRVRDHELVIPGTSITTPIFAGLIARINELNGKPVGFIHPVLYQTPGAFKDIADGLFNSCEGAPGYPSIAGWDACTGLGVLLNPSALCQALQRSATLSSSAG
jgi:kumamolisin